MLLNSTDIVKQRKRKSRCVLEDESPICVLCRFHNQECTFLQNPQSRKRKAPTVDPTNGNQTNDAEILQSRRRFVSHYRSRASTHTSTDSLARQLSQSDHLLSKVVLSKQQTAQASRSMLTSMDRCLVFSRELLDCRTTITANMSEPRED